MKAIISLAIFLMATLTAWADSAKDRWTIYPSYSNITEIEPVGNICFVLASGAVFSYNITDGDVQTYDKAGVMSDVEVSHIGWSKVAKRLVVVYTNSNIDLLSANGDVINVPDLYRKSMTDNKTINHIDFDGFDAVKARGRKTWNDVLGKIEVKSQDIDHLRTFYSCLYRSVLFPRSFYEKNAQGEIVHYSPYNGEVLPGFWNSPFCRRPRMRLVSLSNTLR